MLSAARMQAIAPSANVNSPLLEEGRQLRIDHGLSIAVDKKLLRF